jgi:hypothetical protein
LKQLSISPSRNAHRKSIAKTLKPGRKDKVRELLDECHALNAGQNAAFEEVQAEERDIRKVQANQEFLSNIRRAVKRREQLAKEISNQKNIQYVRNHNFKNICLGLTFEENNQRHGG